MSRARSPERAAAVIDRASRSKAFAPSIFDKQLFSRQMKTPRPGASPFGNLNALGMEHLHDRGVQQVNLRHVVSDQRTISPDAVKKKIGEIASGKAGTSGKALPMVIHHNGTYHVIDGNHRLTAQRALGSNFAAARVVEFKHPPAAAPMYPKAPSIPKGVGGRIGMAVAVAGAAYGLYKGYQAAKAPASAQGSSGGNGKQSYTTKDGRGVQGTKAQVAAWQKRRTASA